MAKTSKKKRKSRKTKTTKGKTTKPIPHTEKKIKIEKVLVHNFVALQKVMVNLSAKFDILSHQISKLLELFEISAKSLAQKDIGTEKESKDTKKILEKLDNISQQAGLIGKGLVLIHETGSEKEIPEIKPTLAPRPPSTAPRPPSTAPRPPSIKTQRPIPPKKPEPEMQGYQRSIASRTSEENA